MLRNKNTLRHHKTQRITNRKQEQRAIEALITTKVYKEVISPTRPPPTHFEPIASSLVPIGGDDDGGDNDADGTDGETEQ